MKKNNFKTHLGETIFYTKYANSANQSWYDKAVAIVEDVCGHGYNGQYPNPLMSKDERDYLVEAIYNFKIMPGGRYIYYAGREANFYNNCFLLGGTEDTREEWARLTHDAMSCLTTGGGIGIDYSVFRPRGKVLGRTGGEASGPIPLMSAVNEVGRNVMQGGSRRSAMYASLNWQHDDAEELLFAKNWKDMEIGNSGMTIAEAKEQDFNYPAPLDMTNISLNYDDAFLEMRNSGVLPYTFIQNVRQALSTGEPGFSFNFGEKEAETLRNACTEVTSEDDSDVCNLASVNLAAIQDIEELEQVVRVASKFLVCGTIRGDLPYDRVYEIRQKNRRLGLGLMGVHEWLLQRNQPYEVVPELHEWLAVYKEHSESAANEHCDRLFLNRPVAYRAVAPTGTIAMLAGTTTGIEPLFAVAYKRRYLKNGDKWHYTYVIDTMAQEMIDKYGLDPEDIDTAADMAKDVERRIKFQADIQDYVDMGISSTINLPAWGSEHNNESHVLPFAKTLADYAHRLRGFTAYPDGARGGQPITAVPYAEAATNANVEFEENSDAGCQSGVCGV